jgi:acyl-CoA thioester hydrolase
MEFIYKRKINYYETDKMGVVHHSNYIRFMEEARCAWLESMDIPFPEFEANGITIPVLGVTCNYKHHVTYGDTILISLKIKEYTGVRLIISYKITEEKTGIEVLTGETSHCFTTLSLKPINLKKHKLDFSKKFENLL